MPRYFQTASFRLTILYAGVFGLSVAILFAVIYWTASGALQRQAVDTVDAEIAALRKAFTSGGVEEVVHAVENRLASDTRQNLFHYMQNPSGATMAGNFPERPTRLGWSALLPPTGPGSQWDTETRRTPPNVLWAGEEQEHTIHAFGIALADGSRLWVGYDYFRIYEAQEAIARAFLVAFVVTMFLALASGYFVSRRFLARVDDIARTTQAIVDGALTNRAAVRGTGDEIDRIALGLNEMLDRIQELMDGLRQVSNDIAHDLKTPLSRLRQRLETTQIKATTTDEYRAAVREAIAETDTILAIFSALLRIARIEAGARRNAFATVDMGDVFAGVGEACGGRRGQGAGADRGHRSGRPRPRRPRFADPDDGQPDRERDHPYPRRGANFAGPARRGRRRRADRRR